MRCLTIHRCKDDSGVVVGNNICIAVLWLVDVKVGVLPCELLSWINRLTNRGGEKMYRDGKGAERGTNFISCLPTNEPNL